MRVMTGATILDLIVLMVGGVMAIGAPGNDPLGCRTMMLVAIATADGVVMRTTVAVELGHRLTVTGGTELHRCLAVPAVCGGLVWIMAAQTLLDGHLRSVAIVAVETAHHFAFSQTVR